MPMIHVESFALNSLTSAIIHQSIMLMVILIIIRDLAPVTILPKEHQQQRTQASSIC